MSADNRVITIDGPAGAGKSTVAKELAHALKVFYLDTGAMYRALTLKAIRRGVNLENEEELIALARGTKVSFEDRGGGMRVFLDGADVSEEIRSPEVTNKTFYAARAPGVREIMGQWQRDIGRRQSLVVEGRDAGTVVFTNAFRKFYLDADFEERSRRRIQELREKGNDVEEETLKNDLKTRDGKDLTRQVGPLKKADDAVVIDSTHLSVDEVVAEMLKWINR